MSKGDFVRWFAEELLSEQELIRKTILEILPQGHGGGFNADLLDTFHAEEIIEKASTRGYLLTRKLLGTMGGGGGMSKHGNEYHTPNFHPTDSDLLPATTKLLSVGSEAKAWLRETLIGEGVDLYAQTNLGRLRVGGKVPSDIPTFGGYGIPFIDLYTETPIGTSKEGYLIMNDGGDFKIWELPQFHAIAYYTGSMDDWGVSGHFGPMADVWYDLGGVFSGQLQWRDIGQGGFLWFGDIQRREIPLPTPAAGYRLAGIGSKPTTGPDNYKICRKRNAGDYKWKDILHSDRSFSILKDASGITKTNIGTSYVEILPASMRTKIDLSELDQYRLIFGGANSEAGLYYAKFQYSTDEVSWTDLSPELSLSGTAESKTVSSWTNIPTAALDDMYIRVLGKAQTTTADPNYKNLEMQVK